MAEHASGELTAGWKKDPFGRHFGRYWNGEQWTDHVISAETVPSIDPVDQRDDGPERTPAQAGRAEPPSPERLGSWRRDPSGRHSSRYWDGWRWTEHVMSADRVPGIDQVPPPDAPAAPTKVKPAAAGPGGSGASRWLPSRAWSALGIVSVIVGAIIVGAVVSGGGARPVLGNGATTVTGDLATTAPAVTAPLTTTGPLAPQAPIAAATAPADAGAPASTQGTVPGSQSPVDPPTTVPQSGDSTAADAMTTTS